MRHTARFIFSLAILVVLGTMLGTSCGRKVWPEPRAEEDRFSFASVKGTKKEGCLHAEARLNGAVDNLARITLQFSSMDADCEECPFKPEGAFDYYPGGQDISISGDYVRINYCGLEKSVPYRWRLAAHNRFSSLRMVLSPVSSTAR